MTMENKVDIPVDLPEEMWFHLMIEAHNQDITLNQLVNNILKEQLAKLGELNENQVQD